MLGVLVSTVAMGWAMAALWPRADLPAWPAVSMGLAGVALSWRRGPVLARAFGSIVGTLATGLGSAQIAALWMALVALRMSHM